MAPPSSDFESAVMVGGTALPMAVILCSRERTGHASAAVSRGFSAAVSGALRRVEAPYALREAVGCYQAPLLTSRDAVHARKTRPAIRMTPCRAMKFLSSVHGSRPSRSRAGLVIRARLKFGKQRK